MERIRGWHARRAAAAVCATGALALSGCAVGPLFPGQGKPAVAIGIDPNSSEQIILGEIYRQVLMNQGRPTSVTAVNLGGGPFETLTTTPIDFVITCTGQLLDDVSPATASELEHTEEEGEESFTDVVYRAAVATFPSGVRTVDPSPAQGCGAGEGEGDVDKQLPQNIIPVFGKGIFDRGEMNRLNFVTRAMATDHVAEMVEDLESGTPLREAIRDWLLEYAQMSPVDEEAVDDAHAADPDSANG